MKLNNIKGDLFGGLTAGIVALPLALAFGVQSGLGASAGLYGAMFLGFFAAIFGGTNTQISGPTGPMTVVTAVVVSSAIAKYGNVESAIGVIILTFLAGGLFQVIFGLLKIGKYIKYIPYPVLSGFMTGIGVIIIALQLFPLLGLVSPSRIIDVVLQLPEAITHINAVSLTLGLITIAIIYIAPKITKLIPGTLIALLVITTISTLFSLQIPTIGNMPVGFPKVQLMSIFNVDSSALNMILIPAITLAGLGTIDSLLTSVVADNITRTKHNSNRELIGQGVGNMIAALFAGIPGAGATMRTVVNVNSGGRTKISGIIHAAFLMFVLFGIGKYVAYIPLPVLAGILITVGVNIIDKRGVKSIFKIPKSDAFVLVVVLVLTVFVDLLQAVGIGMVLASLMFMRKASEMVEQSASLEKVKQTDKEIARIDEMELMPERWDHVYIKHLEGPVFFGVASKILERITKIPEGAEVIIFRMKQVPYIDQSGLYAIADVVTEMQRQGIKVLFSMIQEQPIMLFKSNRFIPDVVAEDCVFDNIEECAKWLKFNYVESSY